MIRLTQELLGYAAADLKGAVVWILEWYFSLLPFLKGLSFVVCAILVWGIWYSIATSGYLDYESDLRHDRRGGRHIVARKMRRKWKSALARIQDRNNREEWTAALKDADGVVQEAFRVKGYAALNDSDRSRIAYEAAEYETLPLLKEAQAAYKKAKTETLPFTHEEAVVALRAYKKVIRETGILAPYEP
jgi:hypothetical protein